MLLIHNAAPLKETLIAVAARFQNHGASIAMVADFLPGKTAFCGVFDGDALDDPFDPSIDRVALSGALTASRVPLKASRVLADAIAQREEVLDLAALGTLSPAPRRSDASEARCLTLFELFALDDVLGKALREPLNLSRVLIDRRPLPSDSLNHCEIGEDGVARIRLLKTNGITLAGRTHALVHELGHALIGLARLRGRPYRAPYGRPDYGRFLSPDTFDTVCDEEALVRAMADAWLLRRSGVIWSRTFPGAVDAVARDLDGDDLAAFVRFRLSQGWGFEAPTVMVRTVGREVVI
ncbi:MAG: hypothetical protein NVS3B20_16130 [Polyangiales bacterium]